MISIIIIAVPTTIPRTSIILPHLFFQTPYFSFFVLLLTASMWKKTLHFLEIKHFHDAYKSDI